MRGFYYILFSARAEGIINSQGGDAAVIQAASVSLHGPHGQYIENVHLLPYESEADFWSRLYPGPYSRLLEKAEAFLKDTAASGEAMVFIRYTSHRTRASSLARGVSN